MDDNATTSGRLPSTSLRPGKAVPTLLVALLLTAVVRPGAQVPAYSGAEWGAPGGDWASTRYSTLSRINTTNVRRLGGAWAAELPARQVSKAPLMVKGGRMFVPTSQGTILALDPSTGTTLWTYEPTTPFSGNRGVGIGEGLLFGGLRNSNVVAISQETGKVVWTYEHGPEIPSQGMSAAPAYGNGVVVAVVSLGDNFLRGRAIGLDAKTGKFLWTFEVVPGPGEPGHETWPQDSDIWKYGGGAIWTSPSVDADLGLVYLETGNAVPQWGGEHRPGNNLFNNSVVALDLKTGKMRWHFQSVHHDIWEHDLSTPLVLYDATIGGRPRKVLVAMRTDGIAFFLDRATGPADRPDRGTSGAAGSIPADIADAAVLERGRSHRAAVRGRDGDPAGVHRRLLLRSGSCRHAQRADAAHEHAAIADGLQPADGISLRDGLHQPGVDPP
jgi:glucose dehydrogenase